MLSERSKDEDPAGETEMGGKEMSVRKGKDRVPEKGGSDSAERGTSLSGLLAEHFPGQSFFERKWCQER